MEAHNYRLTSNVADERANYVEFVKRGAACINVIGLIVFCENGFSGKHGQAVIKDVTVRVVTDTYGKTSERIVYLTEGDFSEYIDCYPGPSLYCEAGSDQVHKMVGRQYVFTREGLRIHLADRALMALEWS